MIDINNQDMLKCVVSDCLGSLPEHPELMTTFLTYLDNDRNMNHTAKELFIHVNSVKYRLQQIYNILPIQLNTSYDRLQSFTDIYSITSNKAILNFSSAVTL